MRKLYPAIIAITLATPAAYAEKTIRLFGKQIPLPSSRATSFHEPPYRKAQKQSRATQSATRHLTRVHQAGKEAHTKEAHTKEAHTKEAHTKEAYAKAQEAPVKTSRYAVEHALHWKLANGPLSEALRQKLAKTNHHLVWKPGIDYRITVPIDIQAPSVPQALDQVSRLYGLPMSVCNGNHTVVVYPAGTPTTYMRCGAATPVTINDAHESKRPTTQIRSAIRKAGEAIWTIEDRGTF